MLPDGLRTPPRSRFPSVRPPSERRNPWRVFDYGPLTWASPQKKPESRVHSLGTVKLSRLRPQGLLPILHQTRSRAWGFVVNDDPQPVDRFFLHRSPPRLSTGGPQARRRCPQLLHTPVHCSATRHPLSPPRVKGVTRGAWIELWGTGVKLGTGLGRSHPALCIGCAELSRVHRNARLSTGATHRVGGQKTAVDLRKRRYPRFPQGLLLLPLRVSQESASKRGLCTTRAATSARLVARLDPEQRRVSVPYVRLDPGGLPQPLGGEPPVRRRRPAGRASNSRRRFR